jgi:flagellar assembly protein FliH
MLRKVEGPVRPMEYPALAGTQASVIGLESPVNLADRVRELESKLEERESQLARTVENVRREALDQGREEAGGDQAAWRERCTALLRGAVDEFRADTDRYLAQVEHEVVRLALAVAERILHRETQLDPLLLSGAVRVALGQLAESTEVRLRVPAAQKEMWSEMVRLMPGLPIRPEVRGEDGLEAGEAVLETNLGAVDLGLCTQLGEIERGFFDQAEVRRDSRDVVAAGHNPNGKED